MKPFASILIVDDEPQLRKLLARLLSVEGFEVEEAQDAVSGLKKLESNFYYVVLLDIRLPDGNGVELTKVIKEKYPETEIILYTAYGAIADGVNGIKNGAFDYLVKGDDNNKIIPLLNKAIEKAKTQFQQKALKQQNNKGITFNSIIGKSVLMKHAISLAKKVSAANVSVLLSGQTGGLPGLFLSQKDCFIKR
ncbi:MAG: sigma-54-dependent Fis family transcriptional regulator [Bacteroidia bacterium]|nr:sigma-54-dependent Fis family transcriptional regulator [Bacteroidia bacterium]